MMNDGYRLLLAWSVNDDDCDDEDPTRPGSMNCVTLDGPETHKKYRATPTKGEPSTWGYSKKIAGRMEWNGTTSVK